MIAGFASVAVFVVEGDVEVAAPEPPSPLLGVDAVPGAGVAEDAGGMRPSAPAGRLAASASRAVSDFREASMNAFSSSVGFTRRRISLVIASTSLKTAAALAEPPFT